MKNIQSFDEFVNESKHDESPSTLADFLNKESKHFSSFLKPKRFTASVSGDILEITPASGSFTITADFKKKSLTTTGKPEYPESVSYTEIMEYVKRRTGMEPVNESNELNEGQYSWFTQDTGQQIGNMPGNRIKMFMFDNEGNKWAENKYEGYGEFGGMDYYELLAKMNGYPDADRSIGIDIEFGKKKTKAPRGKILYPALVAKSNFNWKRHDFTTSAESDPDQGWINNEDDWDEDSFS